MSIWFAASISRKEETTADLNRVALAIHKGGGTVENVENAPIVNTGNCQWVITYFAPAPIDLTGLVDQTPGPKR